MSYPTAIRVIKFLVSETGTYNDQYNRPYVSNLTQRGFNQILQNVVQAPTINPSVFAGLTSEILMPSATYESNIQIPNGWGERRFRFLLHLEIQYKTGGFSEQILTGWSETPASTVSLYGTMDPNTIFRINNSVIVRKQETPTNTGIAVVRSLSDCSHVLADNNWERISSNNKKTLMRPSDVYSRMLISGLENQLEAQDSHDCSATLSNIATKSKRSNGVATNYLTDITKSWMNATTQLGFAHDQMGKHDAITAAQGYCSENSSMRDPFMETIMNLNSSSISDTFTLSDLHRLDPNVSQVSVYTKLGHTDIAKLHQSGQTMGWGGSDLHTQFATILSNSVPALMMGNLITKIAFVTSNMDISGQFDTRIADIGTFAQGINMEGYARNFVTRLEHDVLNDLARTHEMPIGLQMEVDLLGETWIRLTLNNETIDYVTPSFCDAIFAPVITTNNHTLTNLATEFDVLLDNIADAKTEGQRQEGRIFHATSSSSGQSIFGQSGFSLT